MKISNKDEIKGRNMNANNKQRSKIVRMTKVQQKYY